ncbi:hypothetical protein Q4602_05625 [Paraglaciecola chathamensis]|uniref:hypothetical protein n=1 Tax=Paraglaciecola chathamensis TaxID=368405 RepID=UPI0026F5713C|nr:hypothetical protein [Paraglaciecola chathamensis]MDO6838937.1 hypothetical protein [Paraglaciecola chathamensis]
MRLSKHAELRSSQRSISEEEIVVLAGIGLEIEQKGGTVLITVPKHEKSNWIRAIKEALRLLNAAHGISKRMLKRKRKVLKRLLERFCAKNQPYFIKNMDDGKVITCGHYSARSFNR